MQKGVDGETKGKEFDKNKAELRKEKRPPQAPPEEGMWEETGGEEGWPQLFGRRGCAWRDTECWLLGIEKDEKIWLKGQCFILEIIKFRCQSIAL